MGYAKSESGLRKSNFYKKSEFWLGLLAVCISFFALHYSCEANRQSKEVFEWQKEVEAKRQETELSVDAQLDYRKLFFDGFEVHERYLQGVREPVLDYYGFYFYVRIQVYNQGSQPASVSGAWTQHTVNSQTTRSFSIASAFDEDLTTQKSFPLYLSPKQEMTFWVPVEWPVDAIIQRVFGDLVADSVYTYKDILDVYYSRADDTLLFVGFPPQYSLRSLVKNRFIRTSENGDPDLHQIRVCVEFPFRDSYVTRITLPESQ